MGHYRDSPGLSQVLVRENTHIPQYLVSQDTQDILGIPRTVPGSPTILGKVQSGIKPHGTKFPGIPRAVLGSPTILGSPVRH